VIYIELKTLGTVTRQSISYVPVEFIFLNQELIPKSEEYFQAYGTKTFFQFLQLSIRNWTEQQQFTIFDLVAKSQKAF